MYKISQLAIAIFLVGCMTTRKTETNLELEKPKASGGVVVESSEKDPSSPEDLSLPEDPSSPEDPRDRVARMFEEIRKEHEGRSATRTSKNRDHG